MALRASPPNSYESLGQKRSRLRDEDKRGYLDSVVKVSKQEISRDELASRLGEPNQPLVIDVLPE